MIDNYDSFTFNLVHYFESLDQEVKVIRNDQISVDEIRNIAPEIIVISPGPCDPDSAGVSLNVIKNFAGKIPILGVCLGHQCIAQHFGAKVVKAHKVMHGKISAIQHKRSGLFDGIESPLQVTRYHSLVVDQKTLPKELEVTAWTTDNNGHPHEIMALAHKTLPIASVQFHPESIMTNNGHQLLKNFIARYTITN